MATHNLPQLRGTSSIAARAEALLYKYPNLSEIELTELINLMPSVPILDFGLMTADAALSTRLDAFYRQHGRKIRSPVTPLVIFLLLPLAVVAATSWWLMG